MRSPSHRPIHRSPRLEPLALLVGTALLLGAALHSGCGDSAATAGDLQAFCQANCAWKQRCRSASVPMDQAKCISVCEAEGSTLYGKVRDGFVDAMVDCFEGDAQCHRDGDDCYAQAITAIIPAPLEDPGYKRCIAARDGCKAELGGDVPYSDDLCADYLVLVSAAQSDFAACYERACDAMGGCVKAVLGEK